MKKNIVFKLILLVLILTIAGCNAAPNTTNEAAGTANEEAEPASEEADAGSEEANSSEESADTSGPASDITVRVGITGDWATLSPFAAVNLGRLVTNPAIYERLFTPAEFGGELIGVIGKSYEMVGDLVVRVTIYENIHDTAGNPIKAEDVKYSYDMAKESGFFPRTSFINDITVVDENTLDFTFNAIELGTLENVFNHVDIVSQKAYEASEDGMATAPIGSGPYKVVENVSGSSLTLEKTGDYWQEDALVHPQSKSNPDTIVFKIIQDPAQMAIALETGEIDVASSVASNEITRFMDEAGSSKSGYTVAPWLSNVTRILYFNVSEGNPFANKDLRKAVLYAIDNNVLLQGVLSGLGEADVTFGGSVFGNFQDKWVDEDYYNFDLDKASEALAASGVNVDDLKIRIMTSANPELIKAAQIIQAELLEIGLNSEVLSYEEALYQSYLYETDQWDIQLNMKGSGPKLANLWQYCFDARQYEFGTQNFVVDPKLQELMEVITVPGQDTTENIEAFHQYLKEEAYAYGLYNPYSYAVGVDGVTTITYYEKPFVLPGGFEFSSDYGK